MSAGQVGSGTRAADVLVVEDEQRLRSFLLRALPEMGLTGVGAASVDEARRLLEARDVRVLLLDIRLGVEDGLAMLESLRTEGETRPAVFMTAYADVTCVQRALRCEATDFITKPFTLEELEGALSRACRRSCADSSEVAAPSSASEPRGRDHSPGSIEAIKRSAVVDALERAAGNKAVAARELGISRRTLYNWLERFGSTT